MELVDFYQYRMTAYAKPEILHRNCVFETFARRLPPGRQYGVVAGIGPLNEALRNLKRQITTTARWFSDNNPNVGSSYLNEIDELLETPFRLIAMPEGSLYYPNQPILTFEGPFGLGVLLETIILGHLNHGCAVAAAASVQSEIVRRLTNGYTRIMEAGTRRIHPQSSPDAARAAYIGGFDVTSNIEAQRRYGIPAVGTTSHAWVLVHDTESEAFGSQIDSDLDTVFLLDTYNPVDAFRKVLRATDLGRLRVRLDSGNLTEFSHQIRGMASDAGRKVEIILSGDLDAVKLESMLTKDLCEWVEVGTNVVLGDGHPSAGLVFKLTAVQSYENSMWFPKSKTSPGKASPGGIHKILNEGTTAVNQVDDIISPVQVPIRNETGRLVDMDAHSARALHLNLRNERQANE